MRWSRSAQWEASKIRELSTLSDPLADVSYLLRSWASPDEAAGGEGPPAAAAGFPGRHELSERYAAGRALDGLAYWMALDAWRSSAIAEGVCRRYVDGKMGDAPPDVECYTRSVEVGVHQGLVAAGLE
jgi:aminoglycoside phosphotransferase (APT) family kinase protein